jgi:hypothetical protein
MRENHNVPNSLIFNMDETQVGGTYDRGKIAGMRGGPKPCTPISEEHEHVTLVLTINMFGQYLTPLAIYPLKTVPDLGTELPNFFNISGSDKGWINKL